MLQTVHGYFLMGDETVFFALGGSGGMAAGSGGTMSDKDASICLSVSRSSASRLVSEAVVESLSVPKMSRIWSLVMEGEMGGATAVTSARFADCWRCGIGAGFTGTSNIGMHTTLRVAGGSAVVGVHGLPDVVDRGEVGRVWVAVLVDGTGSCACPSMHSGSWKKKETDWLSL